MAITQIVEKIRQSCKALKVGVIVFAAVLLLSGIIWHYAGRTDKKPTQESFVPATETEEGTRDTLFTRDTQLETSSSEGGDSMESARHVKPEQSQAIEKPQELRSRQTSDYSDRSALQTDEHQDLFDDIIEKLHAAENREDIQSILSEMEAELLSLPAEQAASVITEFLNTDDDVDLGMPFRVGTDGRLGAQPTLRVAVLDLLGQIAPDVAMNYSMYIFESSSNPDEWAVAIRNYGRLAQPGNDPYFDSVIRQMVTLEEWQKEPTGGYLEALDAVVFNKQYDLVPDLIELRNKDSQMALVLDMVVDAMVQYDRSEAFIEFNEMMPLMDEVPRLRANLMARADVRDSNQKQIVEEYLLDPGVDIEEKSFFLRLFPNFSRFASERLLTEDKKLPIQEKALIDAATFQAIIEWEDDNRFKDIVTHLNRTQNRLAKYVSSAKRGGLISYEDR